MKTKTNNPKKVSDPSYEARYVNDFFNGFFLFFHLTHLSYGTPL
jgi:hypothetical protein